MSLGRRRRVLIFTCYFPPCSAVATHRTLGFVRHLPAYGWDVDVIAPDVVIGEPTDRGLLQSVPTSATVERVTSVDGNLSRLASSILPFGGWLGPAWQRAVGLASDSRIDCVITTSPPDCVHLLGYRFSRKFRVPWIADLRDPLSRHSTLASRLAPRGVVEQLAATLAKRYAHHIAANTPSYRRALVDAHPNLASKISVLTNGFDFPAQVNKPNRKSQSDLIFLHAGEIYNGRDPRPLFTALGRLRNSAPEVVSDVKVTLIGGWDWAGFDMPAAIKAASADGMVELRNQVPHAEALAAMRDAAVLVLLQRPTVNGIPAKLYEYLSIGCPVLAIADPNSDIAWVLETSGVTHRIVAPDDAVGVERAVIELCRLVREGRARPAAPSQLRPFSRARIAEQLAHVMTSLEPAAETASSRVAEAAKVP